MSLPPRFIVLKQEIASSYPDFEERVTQAWIEILAELELVTASIAKCGPDYIPQVNYSDLGSLNREAVETIKQRGCVVIKNIVDNAQANKWKASLEEYVTKNPGLEGYPANKPTFYEIHWTKVQVQARAHPNILKSTVWLSKLYHLRESDKLEGVDLSRQLSYADRFRIRRPGAPLADILPPHVDGPTIERWEDPVLRDYFSDIFSGNWRLHDPYKLKGRIEGQNSLYARPNQASIFRSFQGWLAISETGPTEGTIQFFPNILLANAYLLLRPFFRPTLSPDSEGYLDGANWEFDISTPDFPGINPRDGGYIGPQPTTALHPHLRLDKTLTSAPKVYPGDAVFWHCDLIHAVEEEHKGNGDSAVIYIPAVPVTPQNQAYIEKQKETFLIGQRPPDFPQGVREDKYLGFAKLEDISPDGRRAMGFPISIE